MRRSARARADCAGDRIWVVQVARVPAPETRLSRRSEKAETTAPARAVAVKSYSFTQITGPPENLGITTATDGGPPRRFTITHEAVASPREIDLPSWPVPVARPGRRRRQPQLSCAPGRLRKPQRSATLDSAPASRRQKPRRALSPNG